MSEGPASAPTPSQIRSRLSLQPWRASMPLPQGDAGCSMWRWRMSPLRSRDPRFRPMASNRHRRGREHGRSSPMSTTFRTVSVEGVTVNVRVEGTTVVEVGAGVKPHPTDDVIDGNGGTLIPGLHDHHIHLLALAAAQASTAVGPPDVNDMVGLAAALQN